MSSVEATIITALIAITPSIITIVINQKIKKQSEIQEETKKLVEDLKKDSQKRDKAIMNSIKEDRLINNKRWLLDFLTKVQKNEKMSDEQIQMAYESKKQYNFDGGDSYIDDLWEKCKKNNLF